jgi:hypothetical protein
MGQQMSFLVFSGSIGGLTFYELYGKYYVRSKSSLDKARVSRDPAFARSRVASSRFGLAARVAGNVYRLLPRNKRKRGLIGKLTGLANQFLFTGEAPGLVFWRLWRRFAGPSAADKLRKKANGNTGPIFPPAPALMPGDTLRRIGLQYSFVPSGIP